MHAVFRMVQEFSGDTTREDGVATTAMNGVLTPGRLITLDVKTTVPSI